MHSMQCVPVSVWGQTGSGSAHHADGVAIKTYTAGQVIGLSSAGFKICYILRMTATRLDASV